MQVSDIAREMAAFSRLGGPADDYDLDAVWRCFAQMAETEASNATDVLALLATVRTLLNASAMPFDTVEGYSQHCALVLIRNAIQTLERVTGEREATFTGREQH